MAKANSKRKTHQAKSRNAKRASKSIKSTAGKSTSPQPSPDPVSFYQPTSPDATRDANHTSDSQSRKLSIWQKLKQQVQSLWQRWQNFRHERVRLHRSFKRSYREDYLRETKTPGLLSHVMTTFQFIFKRWRTFLPFVAVMTIMYIVLVGLLSEDLYTQFQDSIDNTSAQLAEGRLGNFAKAGLLLMSTITTGGLDSGMGEAQVIFMLLLFLIIWLVTIYLTRHFLAGGKPKLRDGLYNALAPLLSTLLVFAAIFIQLIPIMLVIITYSAAIATGFLNTPFYALVYFIFAALMILLSTYLLSSSLMGLVAVTAPGVYPMRALANASDLMAGRRVKFIIRIIYLLIVLTLVFAVVMTPIILLDLWLKSFWDLIYGVPVVPFCLLVMTCFAFIYATVYIYRYYRWLLDYQEK